MTLLTLASAYIWLALPVLRPKDCLKEFICIEGRLKCSYQQVCDLIFVVLKGQPQIKCDWVNHHIACRKEDVL